MHNSHPQHISIENNQPPITEHLIDNTAIDNYTWCAIRLFSIKQNAAQDYFDSLGLTHYTPMQFVEFEDKSGHVKHQLKPVVCNIIFLKLTMSMAQLCKIVSEAPFKLSVYRKNRNTTQYYEIAAREMFEFQTMCNPEIVMRQYLSEAQAKLKIGTPVVVKYGPLKGLSGRLVRSDKKYFLLKEVPGMGVMLKVSRWCCRVLTP